MNDMMQIAICEDEPIEARQLSGMLARYLKANSLEADVDVFTSGEAFLAAFEPGKYQIIFMDIYMKKGGVTGMNAAAKATAADRDVAIVFTTSSKAHLEEGYNYSVYYIVKPYKEERLDSAMGKCRLQIERYAKTIEVVVDRHPVPIRLRDIYSVESIDHDCVFKLAAHEITAPRMGFDNLADQLGDHFLRCHRSYIVNLLHVEKLDGTDFIMENGSRAPISKQYMIKARKSYKDFFWKRLQGDLI